jgi:hypothetical protein
MIRTRPNGRYEITVHLFSFAYRDIPSETAARETSIKSDALL